MARSPMYVRKSWRGPPRVVVAGLLVALVSSLALMCAGATWGATTYDPTLDPNSMAATTLYSGAQAWWNAGYTGKGVDVAVIDSGVSPVAGLNTSGKVIYGPDLSLESQNSSLRNLDTYGHGTFMAGLIAGRDSTLTAPYSAAPASVYRGMAPDARIVSLKVGDADGGVDVSQVIAAIDWVIQHKNDNGLNIRVLNLSYGTNSSQAYGVDPLAYAVEQAWNAGIFVVAATGNAGYVTHTGTLTDPAFDPNIFAVGAADANGTASIGGSSVASFSSTGSSSRWVDVVAPGAHMQGLRVPGSSIDINHPEGLLGSRYFRGSGTSEAAAIASGAAALAIQKYPTIDPLSLKYLLMNSTDNLQGASTSMQGSGEIDLTRMLLWPSFAKSGKVQPASTGAGSLELSRGSDHLTASNGVVLAGEQDIFGKPFNSTTMAALEAAKSSWSGGIWNGSTWSGSSWSGSTWSGSTWSGSSWSGSSWSGSSWSGNTWSGSSWSGSSWSGSTWSGSSWSGSAWKGATWD